MSESWESLALASFEYATLQRNPWKVRKDPVDKASDNGKNENKSLRENSGGYFPPCGALLAFTPYEGPFSGKERGPERRCNGAGRDGRPGMVTSNGGGCGTTASAASASVQNAPERRSSPTEMSPSDSPTYRPPISMTGTPPRPVRTMKPPASCSFSRSSVLMAA